MLLLAQHDVSTDSAREGSARPMIHRQAAPQYRPSLASDYVANFYRHAEALDAETASSSMMRDTLESAHFKAIVRMGELAVPLIVRQLRKEPSLLFLALHAITGENPVPPSAAGRVSEMIDHWLAWAERYGAHAD